MSELPNESNARFRHSVYAMLIVLTVGLVTGRILSTEIIREPSTSRGANDPEDPKRPALWPTSLPKAGPTHGANDRSRWLTIWALVDEGTYAIGKRTNLPDGKYEDTGIRFGPGWYTIDMVLHPERQEFYSSKPPILSTLLAAPYWLLQKVTGWNMRDNTFEVVRTLLIIYNVLPFMLYLHLLSRMIDRLATTDWARIYLVAVACFATFLSTFMITLNNHVFGAFGVVFTLYPLMAVVLDDDRAWWRFALAGFFGALTACCELPAAAFGVTLFLLLLVRLPKQTLLFFVPAALVPVGAFLLTNYLAIGEWLPAYEKFGTPWYNYPGGYWGDKKGLDRGGESPAVYGFHLLVGHHGILSLTPVFLLSLAGVVLPRRTDLGARLWSLVKWLTFLVSSAVFVFYLLQTDSYNYGGWTSGPRWFFWLTPLWLLAAVPVADRLSACRWGRSLGYVLALFSALSVGYPAFNPWRHPWLYKWWEAYDWISYP